MIVIVGFGIQWYMEYFNTNIKNVLKKPSEEITDTKLKPYHAISLIAIFAIMVPIFVMNLSRNNNSKDLTGWAEFIICDDDEEAMIRAKDRIKDKITVLKKINKTEGKVCIKN